MKPLQSVSAESKPFTFTAPSMPSTSTLDGLSGTTAGKDKNCWLCETPIKGNEMSQPETPKSNTFEQKKVEKENAPASTPLLRPTDAVPTTELQKPIDTKCYFDFDGKTWSNGREQFSASNPSAVFRFGGQKKGSEKQATVAEETEGVGEKMETGEESMTDD
jgi:hypothetical protein